MARLIAVEDMVGPSVAGRGGHQVHVLQILEGLTRLGHEILFLEYLADAPDAATRKAFETLLQGRPAALLDAATGASLAGLTTADVTAFAERADALIELAAHYRREPWPLLERIRPRILLEQDPGYTHLWASDGDPAEIFGQPDFLFTVGANVGTDRSPIPTCGLLWRPLWPPVVLDWWAGTAAIERDRCTTVGAWRDYGYIELDGRLLGPKVDEFTKFIELPRLAGEPLELVLAIDDDDEDRPRLLDHGWRLEPTSLVDTPAKFANYVKGSLAEFSCAKGGYVGSRSGWFSDRSACYLAAGRPVVLQATGFEDTLPTGEGVFAVSDPDEAAEAIAGVRGDYDRHSRAARRIAREFFDAELLMARMLDACGL